MPQSDAMQKSLMSELIADMKASSFFWSFASSDLFPENGTIKNWKRPGKSANQARSWLTTSLYSKSNHESKISKVVIRYHQLEVS